MADKANCPGCRSKRYLIQHTGLCRACTRALETLVPDLAERTRPADHGEIASRAMAERLDTRPHAPPMPVEPAPLIDRATRRALRTWRVLAREVVRDRDWFMKRSVYWRERAEVA